MVGEYDHTVKKEFNGNRLLEEFGNTGKFEYKVIAGSGHNLMYTPAFEKELETKLAKGMTGINSPIDLKLVIPEKGMYNEEVMSSAIDFFEK